MKTFKNSLTQFLQPCQGWLVLIGIGQPRNCGKKSQPWPITTTKQSSLGGRQGRWRHYGASSSLPPPPTSSAKKKPPALLSYHMFPFPFPCINKLASTNQQSEILGRSAMLPESNPKNSLKSH